ncbi:MAG TPA: hypothetical protein VJQ49_01690, partial [Casimicrobiaceae bacterium]|nr:hypothetical protein [Casimicrobiaceae bacterium]
DGVRSAFIARASDVAGGFAVASQAAAGRPARGVELLVRSFIRGPVRYYQAAAWRGRLLAGFAGERLPAAKPGTAQPAVNRYHRSDALRDVATRLARGFGISGFFSLEGIVADDGGDFHLLEMNRRLVGGAHRGSAFGVDPGAALHAALDDRPSPSRGDLDPGEEHLSVSFPQEWLRDPESEWLRDYPVDVPWDEPELFEAMLGLEPPAQAAAGRSPAA